MDNIKGALAKMESDVHEVSKWININKFYLNVSKGKFIILRKKLNKPKTLIIDS